MARETRVHSSGKRNHNREIASGKIARQGEKIGREDRSKGKLQENRKQGISRALSFLLISATGILMTRLGVQLQDSWQWRPRKNEYMYLGTQSARGVQVYS